MQVVENQVVSGKTITIDEKSFVNCRYQDCTLLYGGGDYAWAQTTFENCRLTLTGPAQRTVSLLGSVGVLGNGIVASGLLPSAPKGVQ